MPYRGPQGDSGEIEIVRLISCPNCGKSLMLLPKNFPLNDVQCTGCNFRAQVKTNACPPKKEIFGATWDIMDKVLKAGYITPSLIVNFKWKEKGRKRQTIRFYPFVPKDHLKMYKTVVKKINRHLKMFNYINLDRLPHFTMYSK